MPKMTGAKFIAETVHGYGITHVFFMPYIGPRALMEMENLGIKRVQTHGEKAAAYMADAYARVKRGPSLCMAQSVGAVNLAAGLQDAYLACSPVIALTGKENQINQQRHAYQEVDHVNPFSAVTARMSRPPSSFPSIYVKPSVLRRRGHRDRRIWILKVLLGPRSLIGRGTLRLSLKRRLLNYHRSDQKQKQKRSQQLSSCLLQRNDPSL